MRRLIKYMVAFFLLSALWAAALFLATLNGWGHKPFVSSNDPRLFSEAVQKLIQTERVGNFAMAVMKEGEVVKEVFYSRGKAVDRNTIFQVSSLSKFVSAAGIMKLVELGKINFDTPVNRYLSRWQVPPSQFDTNLVTVRRLLSHTAGLTDGLGYSGFESRDSVQTLEASLTKANDADEGASGETRVGVEPGSRWKYSGGGFTILQLLVEEVSGQSFDAFMKESVFLPLRMTSSRYLWSDSLNQRLCEFYHADGSRAPHRYYASMAATSLYTTLADLEKFFQVFRLSNDKKSEEHEFLTPSTRSTMVQPHWDILGEDTYGLGCMLYIELKENAFILGHDGRSTPPINTALRINPMTGDGIIVLETGNRDLATRIASDWVYVETSKPDTLLFMMLMPKTGKVMAAGMVLIGVFLTAFGWLRRRKRNQR